MAVSALLFQKEYLGFFCLKQGEEQTINTGSLHETGCNTKGKITAGALGLGRGEFEIFLLENKLQTQEIIPATCILKLVFEDLSISYGLAESLCFFCCREWKFPMYKFATVAEMKPVFAGRKGIKVLAEGFLFVCCLLFSFFWQPHESVEEF